MLDRAIQAIGEAESQLRVKGVAAPEAIKNIIEVMEMDTTEDWMAHYATEEGRAKMEARKHLWSPELQERVSRQWNELIADVESALSEPPASEKAQALASRWNALVEEFTGGDRDIQRSVGNLWANRDKWPAEMNSKAPVIKPEVWRFIAAANNISRSESR